MQLKDFYYDLPQELIAQEPISERDKSRLLILDKNSGNIEHKIFRDILDYINPGDCIVINDTEVIPARLLGVKEDSGGKIEFVLLKRRGGDLWEVILKPGRRAKPGARFVFGQGVLKAEIVDIIEDGNRLVRFEYDGIFERILDKIGIIPLPPYITKELLDSKRYQTVYAANKGSAAAPTAGLHFTNELINEIKKKDVEIAKVTLHVGLGTFRPVKTQDITKHKMHSEFYTILENACNKINSAKRNGKKIIAVGTTSLRVLETVGQGDGSFDSRIALSQKNRPLDLKPQSGSTDIFIYPGYKFNTVDALITNFHLPESTLIMLVSAFAGKDNIFKAYKEAIAQKYRFFSFGDAMFIC